MTPRTTSHAASWISALAMTGAGACLLAYATMSAPDDSCAPWHAASLVAFALAQALALPAVVLVTRAAGPRAAAALTTAWVLACAVPLLTLVSGERLASLGVIDVAHAAGGAVALGLLAAGLSARLAARRAPAVAGGALVLLAAGWAAAWLCSTRPPSKMIVTWSLLNDAASVLEAAAASGAQPAGDGDLTDVARALPAEIVLELPSRDAWGFPLKYARTSSGFSVSSLGSDGLPGPRSSGPIREFRGDLVIADGSFVSWPERPCTDDPALRMPPAIDLRSR